MKFSLIVCTFERPKPLEQLLKSVSEQNLSPDQILIIDGSYSDTTKDLILKNNFAKVQYFKVEELDRGLTKQRNYGITKTERDSEIICFLDDDIVLTESYFEKLIYTYKEFPEAIGVGGYIIENIEWIKKPGEASKDEFKIDGWVRKLGSRNSLRNNLGLISSMPPGYMPEGGNGFSIGFLPPSDKIYPVEFFMGGVSSYRKELFEKIGFSEYFVGYGLYEDMDFCLRASKLGKLYVNTGARLYHYHEERGRPSKFKYGKMVIRNGWYVWKVKYNNPSLTAKFKWHATALLLTIVRLGNILNTPHKKEALTEGLGRIAGWWSLVHNKPKVKR